MSKRKSVFVAIAATLMFICAGGAAWEVRSYIEDNAHVSGDKGQMMLFVRNDVLAALAGTDGDYGPGQVNAAGAVYTADVNTAALLTEADGNTHGGKTLSYARIDSTNSDLTGGADGTAIIAASGSTVIYVVEMLIGVDAQCQLVFTDGSETEALLAPQINIPAYGAYRFARDKGYRFALDASEAMILDDLLAGTVDVRGHVWFYQE